MKRGIVVSDLHLLSWRSHGVSRFDGLRNQLREKDILVLNGDTFDFRWALQSHRETIPFAVSWISELLAEFPNLEIHFISGNHDCLTKFTDRLSDLSDLNLHHHALVLGRNLFLHGDAANYRMNLRRFNKFRKNWENDTTKGKLAIRCYNLSDKAGLSELTHQLYFSGDIAIRRIAWHLDQSKPEWRDLVDDCFFGHTHMPFHNREHDGIRFHNTGSGIRGMEFAPAEFIFD